MQLLDREPQADEASLAHLPEISTVGEEFSHSPDAGYLGGFTEDETIEVGIV
jgi:hypothetical protein